MQNHMMENLPHIQPEPQHETPFFKTLREILKKCSADGTTVDIIMSCPHLYPLSKNSLWVDIGHCQRGGFSMCFPMISLDESNLGSLSENIEYSFAHFDELWDKWVVPHLSNTQHNVVVFDNIENLAYKESKLKFNVEFKFKFLHMECKFPVDRDVWEAGLYTWSLETGPHQTLSLTPTRFLTTYADLIGLCEPLTLNNTNKPKIFVYEGTEEWNQIPFDGVPDVSGCYLTNGDALLKK